MYGQYEFIIWGILCGIVGWVYSARLTDADMILNWWYVICDQRLPKWLAKPICTCYKCVAGEMALWYTLYKTGWVIPWHSLFIVACSISISILTALTLNKYVKDGE